MRSTGTIIQSTLITDKRRRLRVEVRPAKMTKCAKENSPKSRKWREIRRKEKAIWSKIEKNTDKIAI